MVNNFTEPIYFRELGLKNPGDLYFQDFKQEISQIIWFFCYASISPSH